MLTGMQVYPLIAFFAYLGSCMAEFRMHQINYPFLQHVGGEELSRIQMRRYYRFWHFWFPSLLLLAFSRNFFVYESGNHYLSHPILMFIALLVLLGMTLRMWAIYSLGRLWSLRCIYVPDMPPVKTGPYRWLKHPEYLGRTIEGACLLVLVDAPAIAAILVALSMWQVHRISQFEQKQIVELAPMAEF